MTQTPQPPDHDGGASATKPGFVTTLDAVAAPSSDGGSSAPDDEEDEEVLDPDLMKLVLSRMFESHRRTPLKIGRLTVLERLGEGGMGVVYAAYDEMLERKVAVKVLRPSQEDGDELRQRRLLREAQAMARVVHPNVATVHEVGTTDDGAVYLAMEFIRGVNLDVWLRNRERRDWREIVRVFLEAGRGLAAAHRAGMVHRDFKPHNVMVADDGVVKVLDFGLVRVTKVLESEELERGTLGRVTAEASGSDLMRALTRTGALMGTPAYMAPEQLRAEDATEQSDQFSFCAALHQGLYGTLPFPSGSLMEMAAAVLEGRLVPVPSGSGVPAWIRRVLLRGLSLEPGDRFPSMGALLTALERDPEARRRRILIVGTLALTVGGGGFGLARALADEPAAPVTCDDATAELEDTWGPMRRDAVARALVDVGPTGAEVWDRVAPHLDAYAAGWVAMRNEACETHRAAKQSDTLFDLRTACLDQRRAGLDAVTEALASPDASTLGRAPTAVASLPPLSACADTGALTARETAPLDAPSKARVERQREQLARAEGLEALGRYSTALALAEEAIAIARSLDHAPLESEGLLRRGSISMERGRPAEAEALLTEAFLHAVTADDPEIAVEALSKRMFMRGEWMRQVSRALEDRGLADALFQRVPHAQRQHAVYLNNLALLLQRHGDYAEAASTFDRALELKREVFGPRHPEIAFTLANIGLYRFEIGDLLRTGEVLEQAREIAVGTLGPSHPLSVSMTQNLAVASRELGRHDQAQALLERVREAQERDPESGGARMRDTWLYLGLLRLDARDYDGAIDAFERARAIAEEAGGGYLAVDPLLGLSLAHIRAGAIEEGLALQRRALEPLDGLDDGNQAWIASARIQQARGLADAKRLDEALAELRSILAAAERDGIEGQLGLKDLFEVLAEVSLRAGEPAEAERAATRGLSTYAAIGVVDGPKVAMLLSLRGRARAALQRPADAVVDLREAVRRLESMECDADHLPLAEARFALAKALDAASSVDREEPERLARLALSALAGRGAAFEPERAAMEAWLAR